MTPTNERSPSAKYRPALPDGFEPVLVPRRDLYHVCSGWTLISCYLAAYYPGPEHVVADVLARIEAARARAASEGGIRFEPRDFGVWRDDLLVAVVRYHRGEPYRPETILYFADPDDRPVPPRPGWPSRAEWLAGGGERIVLRRGT